MKWFPFQGVILHAADNIERPADHLKLLIKLLSIFNIRIIYDDTTNKKDVPEDARIMCINCGKVLVVC